ncbi:MAG: 6-phosphogluconolactonase [Mangrovicoccus sp.]|nr:6-phosphogluconolactonase [Mangrovicoccus sp.]
MKLVEYPDREMMMIDLAQILAMELEEALRRHDQVSMAVPGGTTPGPIFDALCAVDLDWHRVTILLGDERWLPEDAQRSNARLLKAHLFQERAARANFLPYFRAGLGPSEAAPELADLVAPHLPLSSLLLGMGADMHTASLFPGSPDLPAALADDAPPVMALRAPGGLEPRVSLTAPVLQNAQSIHLVITGPEKRVALEEARRLNDPLAAPVSLVLDRAIVHWAE